MGKANGGSAFQESCRDEAEGMRAEDTGAEGTCPYSFPCEDAVDTGMQFAKGWENTKEQGRLFGDNCHSKLAILQ